MQHLIDSMMATKEDHASAHLWAEYAVNNHGPASLELMRGGFGELTGSKSRRTLRLAIRMAERRLQQRIWIPTVPNTAAVRIADAR